MTLKTISVSWEPATWFFNSKWQCWEGETANRLPNSDTQNTCSAYRDWSQWKKTGMVSNTTASSWEIYLCNIICTPNLFTTQKNLGEGEALSLARVFCLFATESAEPCSSSESRFIWTKAEAPIVQRGPVGRRNLAIHVSDSCNLSLKDTTKMALQAPECCWEFGSHGDIVDEYIREWAGGTWESRETERKVRGTQHHSWKHLY